MRGSNWLVWSISACARSGTAASSGVIFSPDSVRMASGSSLSLARRVTVANCSSSSCKRSSRYWSLFGLIARGRACSPLECGELLGRQQVVVEVAELPRALDPDVAGAQGVLQLGQGADLVEAPVEPPSGVITSGFQRGLMKAVGASAGHLAQVVGVHLSQRSARLPARLRGRRGAQFQHLQQGRRVTAQGGEVLADQVQVVEAFRLGQQLGLAGRSR